MSTSVLFVRFEDGVIMFGVWSTVVDFAPPRLFTDFDEAQRFTQPGAAASLLWTSCEHRPGFARAGPTAEPVRCYNGTDGVEWKSTACRACRVLLDQSYHQNEGPDDPALVLGRDEPAWVRDWQANRT